MRERDILGLGTLAALAPLVWAPLLTDREFELALGLFLAWQIVPFGFLAAMQIAFPRSAVLALLGVLTTITLAAEVAVFFFPADPLDGLVFVFIPMYLTIGLLAFWAAIFVARRIARVGERGRSSTPSRHG